MKRLLIGVADWVESRLGAKDVIKPMLDHPVPNDLGWWYVFGSATMTLFILQIVTGICLSAVYVPSADKAYQSLLYLNQHQELGALMRGMHFWGATLMVVLMICHMLRVFLLGAYKYPRELTWLFGVVLLALTLGLAFSGQVLRWDSDAYWGVGVGAAITGRMPIIGPAMVHALLGGPIIGGETLSRFFALHVFVLTGALIGVLVLHVWLVLKQGISDRPVAGKRVDPATYDAEYHELLRTKGEPFFPNNVLKDGVISAIVVMVVVLLAVVLGPKGPGDPPDPTLTAAIPRPDWEFMPLFALAALSPSNLEGPLLLGLPPLVFGLLFAVPFVSNRGERHPRRRPFAVVTVIVVAGILGTLGVLAVEAPWSPHMNAWMDEPVPPKQLASLTPLEMAGATVFQYKQCINCHAIGGHGGQRGPDLTYVGSKLGHNDLVRQVYQGGGNMPAFGNHLSPAEAKALVAFLQTLHYHGEQPTSMYRDLHPDGGGGQTQTQEHAAHHDE